MPFLESVKLCNFKSNLASKESFLLDCVMEIPEAPLFTHYEPSVSDVRLIDKSTVELLKGQLDEIRDVIERHNNDKSGIQLILDRNEKLPELQAFYRTILNRFRHVSFKTILRISYELDALIDTAINNNSVLDDSLFNLNTFTHDEYNKISRLRSAPPENIYDSSLARELDLQLNSLSFFVVKLHLTQKIYIKDIQKKLMHNGEELSVDNIICPYTRRKISVSSTLNTQYQAEKFLAIYLALAKLSNPSQEDESEEIRDFLNNRTPGGRDAYLQKAERILIRYLVSPKQYLFSPSQQQFLNDIGAAEARRQMSHSIDLRFKKLSLRYSHLWKNEKPFKENVLAVLMDYNKQNSCFPQLNLFITGHWNRHHNRPVARAIAQLKNGDVSKILSELEIEITKHPGFNRQGSLMRRLDFILYQEFISNKSEMLLQAEDPSNSGESLLRMGQIH
ncbi:DUF5617 domain-containing protein [Legionella cardiaca]|uniref:DUF5617 domain-containing protein n=1 Tax=Legionella cardiaca TaxID=1071983 RepID=A0ABY8AR17_9GAMM|nr:DUF5617 domain-containing protein [Legionella cardiaca]WED41965.1 DUF5617 domain-containing protein [Legionella cardiaca]